MNRTQQLKLLNDEIRRLFSEGVSEQDAFDQLQADTRFDSIRRSSVQSLYKKLQKDVDKEARKQKLKERKRQLENERKRLVQYRQTAKELLICENLFLEENQRFMGIWQDRYFVTENVEHQGVRKLKLYDFLQNISKEIWFQSVNNLDEIYALSDNFIILEESDNSSEFIRLAQINLIDSTLKFTQKIDFHNIWSLIVDSFNPSKFLVLCHSEIGVFSVFVCKLVKGKVEVGTEIILDSLGLFDMSRTYFNDQLFVLKIDILTGEMSDASIVIQNLDAEKDKKTLELKPVPSNVFYNFNGDYAWSGNHFFMSIQFCLTNEYGIIFTEPRTCDWTTLEFAIDLPIRNFSVVNKCDLVVCAQESDSIHSHVNLYKLSMRKPDSLRNKAWVKTVLLFKQRQFADPYEEARKYLPLNSDIRGPFAADQSDAE